MITAIENYGGGKKCTSIAGHFKPCGCIEAIWSTPSNLACPGLLWKPLDAAIGQQLAPYRPGGLQGDSKQNDDVKCVHFACRFDGHGGVTVIPHTSPNGGGSWLL